MSEKHATSTSSALESNNKGIVTREEKDTYTTNAHNDGESSCKSLKTVLQKMMEKTKINFRRVPLQMMETLQCSNSKIVVVIVDPPRM